MADAIIIESSCEKHSNRAADRRPFESGRPITEIDPCLRGPAQTDSSLPVAKFNLSHFWGFRRPPEASSLKGNGTRSDTRAENAASHPIGRRQRGKPARGNRTTLKNGIQSRGG